MVVAESEEIAAQAVAAVSVSYEVLPPLTSAAQAMALTTSCRMPRW